MSACNVGNRTIFCDDNIDILPGINSDCIDLIYLDPPFNKNKEFLAPIGSSAEGAGFKDIFREDDLKDEWLLTIEEDEPDLFHYLNGIKAVGKLYNFAYLAYMAMRLIECRRVLKQTGSIYLHCDPTMSHYLKTMMDCIFGEESFRNEIIWKRTSSHSDAEKLGAVHDIILWYAASDQSVYHKQFTAYDDDYIAKRHRHSDLDGRRFMDGDLTAKGLSGGGYEYEYKGVRSVWRVPIERMRKLDAENKLYFTSRGGIRIKRYLDELPGVALSDVWTDINPINSQAKERKNYPTQKPRDLLERIIQASSKESDIVLDPFCGCATTCIAAERLGRNWIGIDISIKAYELVQERLAEETASIFEGDVVVDLKTDPPKRTDQDEDYREQKYVYIISHPNYPGEYKVGIAKNWKSRLNSYQTSDPERQYKMEFKMETPWFRETERHIHDKFDNKHEWVTGAMDDIINEIRSYKPA